MNVKLPTRASWLMIGTTTLTCCAGFLVARDTWLPDRRTASSREFQRLVGGLGMGPAITLHLCESSFDTRLAPNWRAAHQPLVCGEYFCPQHASSIFPLRPVDGKTDGETFDAGVP